MSAREHADPGGVNGRVVLLVALGTVAVMGLGVAVAWELERTGVRDAERTGAAGRFDSPPADLNGIEMSLLAPELPTRERPAESRGPTAQTYALRDRRKATSATATGSERERLQSYGWNDRERRTVHIPLARAIELYLAREGEGGRAQATPETRLPRAAKQPTSGDEP